MGWLLRQQRPGAASRLETAEQFIRRQTALYRHYAISEVRRHVKQFTGVDLTRQEAIDTVQKIRDEFSMGPIAPYNLDPDEEER